MWSKLAMASPAFLVFPLVLYPLFLLSWELWVLKSASARGRCADLNRDAGKCQLGSSQQHPRLCLSQLKSMCGGLGAATGEQAPLRGGFLD